MADWLKIEGRVYIITGGSSGVGEAITKELLANGAKVANFDLNSSVLEDENLAYFKTDVTDLKNVEASVQGTVEHFGTIDGLVNAAGISKPQLLVDKENPYSEYEVNEKVYNQMFDVNVRGTVIPTQAVLRELIKKQDGVIINIGSESGLEGSIGQSVYTATKGAIYGFTRAWAKEYADDNIRIAAVAPGPISDTGFSNKSYYEALAYTRRVSVEDVVEHYASGIPAGRTGEVEEIADAIVFLLSDRAEYITGTTINISGGKSR